MKSEKSRSIEPGFVYVIYSKPIGLYKVGCSKNILARLWSLDSQVYPQPLIPILLVPVLDKYGMENKIHKMFANRRVGRKELFNLENEDILQIFHVLHEETNGLPDFSKIDSYGLNSDPSDPNNAEINKNAFMEYKKSEIMKSQSQSALSKQITALMRSFAYKYRQLEDIEGKKEIDAYEKAIKFAMGEEE